MKTTEVNVLNLEGANWLCNGSFNPLLNEEQLIESMLDSGKCETLEEAKIEYDRRKAIETEYAPKKKEHLSLACYKATYGGTASIKCENYNDLKDAISISGQWNDFYPVAVNRALFHTVGRLKVFYGVDNPNSGVLDAFEYYFEGDAIEVVYHDYSSKPKDSYSFIFKLDGVWQEIKVTNMEDYFKSLAAFLKKEMKSDVGSYTKESHDFGVTHTMRFWWD